MSLTGAARQARLVFRREIRLEIAGREATVTALPFVAAALLLAGISFDARPTILRETAPGLVWLVVLMAATPLTHAVAATERREDAWDLVRAVTSPGALLAGKIAALWTGLLSCWAVAEALAVVLLGATPTWSGVVGGLLGTAGVAALVCVFGVMLGDGARRPGLLAVLLLPMALPALLAGVQTSAPGPGASPWLVLLLAYDAIVLTACWAVFPTLLED